MSLDKNEKISKEDKNKLELLASLKDINDFIEEFALLYGSVCELWMSEKDIKQLAKHYASGDWKFKVISGESEDGHNDSAINKARSKEWMIFAEEQNGDSYDCILYKPK